MRLKPPYTETNAARPPPPRRLRIRMLLKF
jgi:hypothetical protein